MRYDSSRDALYRPQLLDPLDPALFAGKDDARCAELSRLAYYAFPPDEARLDAALAALGFVSRSYFEDRQSNTQAMALIDAAGQAVIAFRGTQAGHPVDAITDMSFRPVDWGRGGKVHLGFRSAYDSPSFNIRAALAGWLADHRPGRLIATGHSLGAALATLLASDHPAAELVTFGSPAVGNAAFAALFTGRAVRRYCNCCDIVVRVPPPLAGFRHTPGLRYIDRSGRIAASEPTPAAIAADTALAQTRYLQRALNPIANVANRALADHAPVNYVSAVLGIRTG
ncbi:MAG: lipase family protein [Sphingomonadales bacterium]|nr:lipase family protein [Sphingomonadales bacterium]